MSDDELAAIAAALAAIPAEACHPQVRAIPRLDGPSRWKVAARNPDLEIEDYRSV